MENIKSTTIEGKNVGKKCRTHYRGTFNDGTQFDSSYDRGEPLEFVCGAGMMIKGFDAAVASMEVGQTIEVHLMPEEAYGQADPDAIFTVELAQLPGAEELEAGQQVYLQNAAGQPFPVKVVSKDDTTITFDANHEMAGKELNFTVNGKMRLVRGQAGEGAVVQLNGRQTNLNARIEQNDIITVQESGVGEPAHMTIEQLEEFQATIEFIVNGKRVPCPKFAYVNGELKSGFYDIQDGDQIQMENFYTVAQLFEFMDYDITGYDVYVNNELADKDTKVYENFSVKTSAITEHAGYEETSEENDGYDTEEQTEDIADTAGNSRADDDTPLSGENAGTQTGSTDTAAQEVQGMSSQAVRNITILINGQPVRLTGKKDYILVDLFQYYEFDLSKPK